MIILVELDKMYNPLTSFICESINKNTEFSNIWHQNTFNVLNPLRVRALGKNSYPNLAELYTIFTSGFVTVFRAHIFSIEIDLSFYLSI